MEFKIIQYFVKNPNTSSNWMSKLFDCDQFLVEQIINAYLKEPFMVKESKINK